MIKKLKNNPQLLFDIIPSSSKAMSDKLRERLKKSQEQSRSKKLINQKVLQGRIRPGTSGINVRRANHPIHNLDLIEEFKDPGNGTTTNFSHKNNSIHPRLDFSIRKLTKDQILKLSDTQLNKYMK